MSAEGKNGSSLKVHELSRQFGRPQASSPPSATRKLPKVLAQHLKSDVDKTKVTNTESSSNGSSRSALTDESKIEVNPDEFQSTGSLSSESDTEEAPPTQSLEPTFRPAAVRTQQQDRINRADCVIGLDQLQEQVRRLALRRGFTLNIMVVGRSGLGKSTLINTLFRSTVLPHTVNGSASIPAKTTEIRTTQTAIHENGVRLDLTVTDTPGFGDRIDNTNCWEPALQYINEQYEKYLIEEQSPERTRWIRDTRIHCCLYFVPPTGHGLRPLDLEVLQRLHNVVNVIPVIAKADTLTLEERHEFKKNIKKDLLQYKVETYPLAKYDHEDDYEVNQSYREMTPFAVVGSEQVHNVMGRLVLGRQNGWGLVQIEDPAHCEFYHLRNLLIRNRMQDLIELTSAIHYEAFRRRRLLETNGNLIDIGSLNESHI